MFSIKSVIISGSIKLDSFTHLFKLLRNVLPQTPDYFLNPTLAPPAGAAGLTLTPTPTLITNYARYVVKLIVNFTHNH